MLDLLTASPCVEAWRAEPLSIAEIDAHPDSARIWATIKAMQGVVEDIREEASDDAVGEVEAAREEAEEEAWDECRDRIAKELARIGDRISAADRNALLDCLE